MSWMSGLCPACSVLHLSIPACLLYVTCHAGAAQEEDLAGFDHTWDCMQTAMQTPSGAQCALTCSAVPVQQVGFVEPLAVLELEACHCRLAGCLLHIGSPCSLQGNPSSMVHCPKLVLSMPADRQK